ncbi:unnamed protein product [Blepharisma stoltei]|uniref:Uncharacterized protein n=1 Tax=Blepharisma stoltei TaxID=1481888 RepID=A0AAU9IZ10_9CILI|nr:unnamed protein product [Blepharisma stoltei]
MNPNYAAAWQTNFPQMQAAPPQPMYGGGFQTNVYSNQIPSYQQPPPPPPAPLRVKLEPRERGLYNLLLSQADPESKGRLEGAQVVDFFKRSGISTDQLKEIWTICTPNGESFLDRERFYVALRLIALAQEGKPVNVDAIYANTPAALPNFKSNVVVKDKWDIEDDDKDKYEKFFNQVSQGKGFLTADEAYGLLTRTGAKSEYLAKIWNMCDPNDSGELNKNHFIVAMHLASKVKALSEPVPDEIPQVLNKIFFAKIDEPAPIEPPKPEAFSEFGINATSASFPSVGFGIDNSGGFGMQASQKPADPFGLGFQTAPSKPIKLNMDKPDDSLMMKNIAKPPEPVLFDKAPAMKPSDPSFEFKAQPLKDDLLEEEPQQSFGRSSSQSSSKKNTYKADENLDGLQKRNNELTEQLREIEDEIQEKLREWRDVRSRLSLERERNQVLASRLEEMNSKVLQDTFQVAIKSFKL